MVISPCVKICELDGPSGLCRGCGRSVAEIGAWLRLSEGERAAVMQQLPDRLAAMQDTKNQQGRSP